MSLGLVESSSTSMDSPDQISNNGYLSPATDAIKKEPASGQQQLCNSNKTTVSHLPSTPSAKSLLSSHIVCPEDKEVCTGCGRAIEDRYIMRVMDRSWHEGCLQCSVCRIILTTTCYSRDCKLYCKADYDKLFATKCSTCLEPIHANDLVMRSLDNVYHLNCFNCVACGRQLEKGEEYVPRAGRLFCRTDFEKEMALMQISSQTSESALIPTNAQNSPVPSSNTSSVSVNNNPCSVRQDGRRGPKRPRTILTTAQRRAFKASFEISQKPCRKVRESLAKETGLSVRIVQVWFQNQRAKLKKIQRKQQQLQQQQQPDSSGQPGSDKGSNLGKMSPYSRMAGGHLTDSSADSPGFSMSQMQYLTHSPDGSYYSPQGGDGYSKADLAGMDSDTSLGGLEDVLINHQNHTTSSNATDDSGIHNHAHHHHLGPLDTSGHPQATVGPAMLFGTSMTPIDKLYSMQNSYFNSADCECLGTTN
ncbi:LIM homeobox transcription factor 1-beta.1 [Halotydeus destructor]|nr:LIM homeobox transcription factor 1-beta.1 [Halotydeus destructor]